MKSKKNILFWALILLVFPVWGQDGEAVINPAPGEYRDDLLVSFTAGDGYTILYGFDSPSTPSIPYSTPLMLSALPGESREYRISAALWKEGVLEKTLTYRYLIDKSPPPPPKLSYPSGGYEDSLELFFTDTDEARIVYSMAGDRNLPQTVWRGEPLSLPGGTDTQIYHISSYSVDSAGNKSPVINNRYEIRSNSRVEPNLRVLSPRSGEYGNRQLLYLDGEGFRWIRYTLNGGDPALTGQDYHSPLLIDRTGTVRLRVAGMSQEGGKIISTEVTFQVTDQPPPAGIPESGLHPTGVTLRGNSPQALFCLEDRIPADPDLPFLGEIEVQALPRGLRTVPLNISQSGTIFRYFYILDNRVPADPLIQIQDPLPLSGSTRITIRGSSFSRINYTLDGTAPDADSFVSNGPFTLNLPEDVSAGSLIIKARAYGQNGKTSSEVSRLITFKKERPDPPQVTVTQNRTGDPALLSYPAAPGLRVVYEISDTSGTIRVPGHTSPVLPNNSVLRVPEGMEKRFYLAFASLDTAGNVSEPTQVREILLNRRNTMAPRISYTDGLCRITGPSPLFYNLELFSPAEKTEETGPVLYSQPFALSGKEGADVLYRVTAWSESEEGLRSPPSSLDVKRSLRIPQPPNILGLTDGEEYLTGEFICHVSPDHPDDLVFYTYSSGDIPPPPVSLEAPKSEGTIEISGKEGEKTLINLSVRSYNRENNQFSVPVNYQFTLNQSQPLIPVIEGYRQGALYNRSVTLSAPEGYGHTVFISHTSDGTTPGDPFGPQGTWLNKKITFTVGEGKAERILFLIGVEDSAGHRVVDEEVRWFGIDRSIPGLPLLSGVPEEITWDSEVTISGPRTSAGGALHYEMTLDGTLPPEITADSPVFSSTGLSIPGIEGEKTNVVLRYRFRNNAGTWSDEEGIKNFMIDRRPLGGVPAPDLSVLENLQQLMITWDIPANRSLYFRFPYLNQNFQLFNEPVTLPFVLESQSMLLEAYLVNDRGRVGETSRFNITVPGIEGSVFIKGVPDPPLANTLVRLYKGNNEDFLRYEVGVNGDPVPEVTRFSPIFPKNLDLAGAPGEILNYVIKVKRFADADAEGSQGEQIIEFSIDNSIPVPPRVVGVASREHYQDDLSISFESAGKVFYALQKGSREDNPGFPRFNLYENPLAITSQEGTFSTYRLYAYSMNEAGNQSEIKEWEFYIDREIIYLSSEGSDRNDGTRTKPFRTLEKALDYSRETGRKSIYLGTGEYLLSRSLTIDSDLKIEGGFDASGWMKIQGLASIIKRSADFAAPDPMLSLQGRAQLKDLQIISDGSSQGPVIRGESPGIVLDNLDLTLARNGGSSALQVVQGDVLLRDSRILGLSFAGSSLISVDRGGLLAQGSRLVRNGENGDGAVISLNQAKLKLSHTQVGIQRGRSLRGIQGRDSEVLIDNDSRIDAGSGTMESAALSLTDSAVKLVDVEISSDSESRLNRGIIMRGGQLLLQDSEIRLAGSLGVVLVQTSGTDYLVLGNRLSAGGSQEYSYLLRMADSDGRVVNNMLRQESSRDSTALLFTGGKARIINNSLITTAGVLRSEGIRATGDLELTNNIILQEGPSAGTALVFQGQELLMTANCFSSWPILLQENEKTYRSVGELNLSDGDSSGGYRHGNIFEEASETFQDLDTPFPRLSSESDCINAGITVLDVKEAAVDIFKNRRPNPVVGNRPLYDVGAEEYTP